MIGYKLRGQQHHSRHHYYTEAAASVPSSLTSMQALCRTLETCKSSGLSNILPNSAVSFPLKCKAFNNTMRVMESKQSADTSSPSIDTERNVKFTYSLSRSRKEC
uniref:Uncharacterized protein n=1 Tax=Glossina pallidipes TaxID=7398 RepID=A0A1A9ZDS1_GLOPL